MKKIYSDNAERQRAYRERKRLIGVRTVTLMVPDDIYEEIKGNPGTLIDAFTEYQKLQHQFNELSEQSLELKSKDTSSYSSGDYNKLQDAFDSLSLAHERLKAEYLKLQDSYSKLRFGDWYSRK